MVRCVAPDRPDPARCALAVPCARSAVQCLTYHRFALTLNRETAGEGDVVRTHHSRKSSMEDPSLPRGPCQTGQPQDCGCRRCRAQR